MQSEHTGGRQGGFRLGRYRVAHPIGEGGSGVVYVALDDDRKAYAVKVLRPHVAAEPTARERLAREVSTLARVHHPSVAQVVEADTDGHPPYIVTEYIPAPSLHDVVRQHGPLDDDGLVRLGNGIGQALAHIHGVGVIHRDLKPANVLIDAGEPVLIDFGIAHLADQGRFTQFGMVMGTPGYVAPEVLAGRQVDGSTDWWAWAAMMAFAATGRPPFGDGPTEAVLDRVRRGEADLRGVPRSLLDVVRRGLSPDPARRPLPSEFRVALVDLREHPRSQQQDSVLDLVAHEQTQQLAQNRDPLGSSDAPGPAPAGATMRIASVDEPAAASAWSTPARGIAAPTQPPLAQQGPGAPTAAVPSPPVVQQGTQAPTAAIPSPAPATRRNLFGRSVTRHDPASQARTAPPPQTRPAPKPQPARTYPQPHPSQQALTSRQAQVPQTRPLPTLAPRGNQPSGPGPYSGRRPGPPGMSQPGGVAAPPHPGPRLKTPRTASLLALGCALAAAAGVMPTLAVVIGFGIATAARAVEASEQALIRRRDDRGRTRIDVLVVSLASPWRLLTGAVRAAVFLIVPLLVGAGITYLSSLFMGAGIGSSNFRVHAAPLILGAASAITLAWWGAGGGSLRRGTRTMVRSVAPGTGGAQAFTSLMALATIAAILVAWRSGSGQIDWFPLTGPPVGWLQR